MPELIKNFVGVLKDPPTLDDIAKKHMVSVESLIAEMEIGVKIEKEHTDDEATAGVIALHQINEDPKFYTKGAYKNTNVWPKSYKARHLEAGLVRYSDLGEKDPATGNPKGMTLLLTIEAINKMRPSFKGKPVVNWFHKDVNPEDFKKGKADGIITGAYHNPADGWDYVDFLVWDEKTKENCDNGYRLSCAYVPTEINLKPGKYHNIPYDGEVISGVYTHMAIVDDPRYERSMIFCNSIGGKMEKLWLIFKNAVTGKSDKVELTNKTEVDIDGNKISLEELVNSFKAEQAAKAKQELENSVKTIGDDTLVTIDGKEVTVKDLKAAHAAQVLKNTDARTDRERLTSHFGAEKATEMVKELGLEKAIAKLPPRGSGPENKNEADKKAEEDAKKKAEEEKRNADEKAAADKTEADKKAADEKRNAADKEFKDLKNAAEKGGEKKELPGYDSTEDKLARGQAMFGSPPETKERSI